MKKLCPALLITFFFSLTSYTQTSEVQKLNLDFEQNEKGYPAKWKNFGSNDYKIYVDSTTVKSGKFSAVIENTEFESAYKALAMEIPENYKGKKIRLSGYIKTENVTYGYAGLWMRIDPQIGFDNMNDRGVEGTSDWNAFEITLPLNPQITDKIVLGGLLVGKGKMWLDDLEVTIDGKELDDTNLQVYTKEISPAEKDTAFDGGSTIDFPNLNEETTQNLKLLGKTWGFLKYHHPEIAKGNYNMDYELFRVLPDYLKVKNTQERDEVLATWIDKFGKLPVCKNCKPTPSDAVLKPDLSWIDNSNLSSTLKKKLKNIYTNRNQGDNYYITLRPKVGNPIFTNENSYSDMPYLDSGFRLLSLFRYWNMIEYFSPNKHLTNKEWDTVLKDYIPLFIHAKNELEYELAAILLIGELNDSHANIWSGDDQFENLKGENYAPLRGEFIENKFIVTDIYNPEYLDNSKLKVGAIITHINGLSVDVIVDSLKPYYPSSNEAAMLRDVSLDLLRSRDTTINLSYIDENQTQEEEITLYEKEKLNMYRWYKLNSTEKCFKILDGNIGYITLANIKKEDIPVIKKSFKETKGIIIDIRNYPSTFVPFELGSYFVSKPTDFVKFTQGNTDNPGEFTFRTGTKIKSDGNQYKGKLVVLVNDKSQSQAEYKAMAFKAAKNSTILGSMTAGADGNISAILLPGGLRTTISGIGVYYPDGTETQRIGIVPDITVNRTIQGVKEGNDELLEHAVGLIKQ